MPTAMGVSAAIVPMEVPMERERIQAIRNTPAIAYFEGIRLRQRFTMLSTPPEAVTHLLNAPAARNMKHIVIMFSFPISAAAIFIFSSKLSAGLCKNATTKAIRKATIAGTA